MMCCSPAAKARVAVRTELVPQKTTDLKTRFMVLPFLPRLFFSDRLLFRRRRRANVIVLSPSYVTKRFCEEIRLPTIGWPPVMFAYLIDVAGFGIGLTRRSGRGCQEAAEV